MVHPFHEVDIAILVEIHLNQQWCKRAALLFSFDENDPKVQAFEKRAAQSAHGGDFESLSDTTFSDLYRLAAVALHQYMGKPQSPPRTQQWVEAQGRAESILKLQFAILDAFEMAHEELMNHKFYDLSGGIRTRLPSLDGFLPIRNQTIYPNHGEHTFQRLPNKYKKSETKVTHEQNEERQQRNATLIAVVFTTTLISFMPTIFAWHRATSTPGTSQDVGFYLLIQNSAMQLLGLFTAMFPIYRQATTQSWHWARAFIILGATCSISSIPLYLYTPTMWSALASFFGSAAQAGMALLLAQMADSVHVSKEIKRD